MPATRTATLAREDGNGKAVLDARRRESTPRENRARDPLSPLCGADGYVINQCIGSSPGQMQRDGASYLKQDEPQAMIPGPKARCVGSDLIEPTADKQCDRSKATDRSQERKEQNGRVFVDKQSW
jgi:hypothetical protein